MQELLNVSKINIPDNPERDWIWVRILISIDFSILKTPTSLQWAILSILTNIESFTEELTTEVVAEKLGVESLIVEEGLASLTEQKIVTLQARKNTKILQNYTLDSITKTTFDKFEKIPLKRINKKFLLFHEKEKNKSTYKYQMVEKSEDEENISSNYFESILCVIIEEIWNILENDPHALIGEIELRSILSHKIILSESNLLPHKILVNFL